LLEKLVCKLAQLKGESMFLAGDIGGTRSRFYAIESDKVVFEHVYASKEHKNFTSIVEHFSKLSGLKFSTCVFGIAGVVIDGRCKTTNLPWEVSIDDIKQVLAVKEGYLVNDLELLTYGLFALEAKMIETIQQGEKKEGSILLICPGTGLGVACATHTKPPLEIFPTEVGHIDFAPTTHLQVEMLEFFLDKLPHVSVERFVSGSGLLNIYQFLCHKHGAPMEKTTSEDITEAALTKQDHICHETCVLFLDMLAATIGNLALSYIPFKGIYMTGALMRKLGAMMDKSVFLKRMSDKGRFEHLIKKLPFYLVKEQRLAVLGALMFFKNLKEKNHGHF
jgi:glucokinase